jgi:hypothetical protein
LRLSRLVEAASIIAVAGAVLFAGPLAAALVPVNVTVRAVENAAVRDGEAAFTVRIEARKPVLGVQFDLAYDPAEWRVIEVTEGGFFQARQSDPMSVTFFHPGIPDDPPGTVRKVAACRLRATALSVEGTGDVAHITMERRDVDSRGDAPALRLSSVMVVDADGFVVLATGHYLDRLCDTVPLTSAQ